MMAKKSKQVISNEVINIDGEFSPKAKSVGELIAGGDLQGAEQALRGLDVTKPDLSASALLADVRAGESEQRQGLRPSMQLTRSGQFQQSPETSSGLLGQIQKARRSDRATEREDKRLRIMADQYRVNTEIKLEKMKNDLIKATKLSKMKGVDSQIKDIQFVLKLWQDRVNSGMAKEDEVLNIQQLTQLGLEKIQKLRAGQ